MRPPTAPIRFLLLVVGGWVGFRAVALWPGGDSGIVADAAAVQAFVSPSPAAPDASRELVDVEAAPSFFPAPVEAGSRPEVSLPAQALSFIPPSQAPRWAAPASAALAPWQPAAPAQAAAPIAGAYPPLLPFAPLPSRTQQPNTARLSASAWLFLRDDAGSGLAPGGTLGGSQAGLRLGYRLNDDARRPLSLAARLYVPVDRSQGSEAVLGLDWRPIASVPVHILVERRQRIGREGRSDFGVTVYGGGHRDLFRGRVRIEAYGQAGIVGIEERDLFVDGAMRASLRAGRFEVGAGAWGGAQPGVSRLDIGPQATMRLAVGDATIRVSADYRVRVAGDAAPASGPALTIATDF